MGEFFGALGEAEFPHAEADGSGTDEDDLDAAIAECGDLGTECGNAAGIEFSDTGGEDAGADFNDDAAGVCECYQGD